MKELKLFESWADGVIGKYSESKTVLTEGKGHLDHPEDAIFLGGPQYAQTAVKSIVKTAKTPSTVTIKWDGYPALIFGRGPDGKFAILDKHMFNKSGGEARKVYSPQQFMAYDHARGADRGDLYTIIQNIWKGLSQEDQSLGYYWGDFLFSKPLEAQNGLYTFKANPNGITYTVDVNSTVGKLITNKIAGVAVHQFIPADAASTDDAVSLNGTIGNLKNTSNVAIVPSAMPNAVKIPVDTALVNKCLSEISAAGPGITQLMTAPQGTKAFYNSNLFTVYINQRVVSGDLSRRTLASGFMKFAQDRIAKSKISEAAKQKLLQHLNENKKAIVDAFNIWADVYNLKNTVVNKLDQASKSSPVKGYLQDGTQTQEGFVANGFKFVDRMGFSRQNLAAVANRPVNEASGKKPTRTIAIYPGRFHPFHKGHAASFKQLAQKYGPENTFLSLSAKQEQPKSPFTAQERAKMARAVGIPAKNILSVVNPYKNDEYIAKLKLDPDATRMVFGVSQKDMATDPRFAFTPKKDGSASYFQPADKNATQPMSQHAYIDTTDTVDFPIAGQSMRDASSIRSAYASADEKTRIKILQDLYGKNYAAIKPIFDQGLGSLNEGDNPNFFGFGGGSSSAIPGTPLDLQPQPTKRQKKIASINSALTKKFTQRRKSEEE
jgi:cytidyltransferase-like protein